MHACMHVEKQGDGSHGGSAWAEDAIPPVGHVETALGSVHACCNSPRDDGNACMVHMAVIDMQAPSSTGDSHQVMHSRGNVVHIQSYGIAATAAIALWRGAGCMPCFGWM